MPVQKPSFLKAQGHTFIIAEAGVNHNGDLQLAKRLVDVAREAGADAVKFQTFKAERLASRSAPKAHYQLKTTPTSVSQFEMLQELELTQEMHAELMAYCKNRGILFLSTPFDEESVDLLQDLGVSLFKIGSGEITNGPFLQYVARKGKPILLSTGMSHLDEVEEAVKLICGAGCQELVLLHCVSDYPSSPRDSNLLAIQTMASTFGVPVGYSDHTPGIEVALAAVALGACVVEKHLTLDKNLPGPDHGSSLEPQEFQALVRGIRVVEQALGDGIKKPVSSETENRLMARRSLAASSNLPAGTVLRSNMLQALRPATGISPTLVERVVGRRLKRSLVCGEFIIWSDLE